MACDPSSRHQPGTGCPAVGRAPSIQPILCCVRPCPLPPACSPLLLHLLHALECRLACRGACPCLLPRLRLWVGREQKRPVLICIQTARAVSGKVPLQQGTHARWQDGPREKNTCRHSPPLLPPPAPAGPPPYQAAGCAAPAGRSPSRGPPTCRSRHPLQGSGQQWQRARPCQQAAASGGSGGSCAWVGAELP